MLGLCALVALAFTSCKKNEEQSKQLTILATITQPVADGRTHIGAGDMLVWDAGNSIRVFNANGKEGDFTTHVSDEWEHVPFTGPLTPTATYTAFYPNAAYVEGATDVRINLNATQNYVPNNFGNDTYPMYATGTTNGDNIEFTFQSHASVLRIQLQSNNACTVGSIIVTGGNNDVFAGNLVYDYSDPSTCTVENGTNQVTLNCGNGVQLAAGEITAFNIVMKSGAMSAGTKVTVKDLAGNTIKEFTTSVANTLQDQHILIMPVKEVVYDLPNVTTTAATGVTYEVATINGNYTFPAGADVTACGFYWGTDRAAVTSGTATKVSCSTVGTPMSYNLTGLTASTTYYFKAWATNESGESCGEVLNFTTDPEPVVVVNPEVQTIGHTITGTSVNLQGQLVNDGNAACTVGIQFSTNADMSGAQNLAVSGTHNSPYDFSKNKNNLQYNVTYYYRAYAVNSTGTTVYGEIMNFRIEWVGHFLVDDVNMRFVNFATGLLWWDNDAQEFAFEDDQYSFHKWQDGESGTPNASFSQFCWSHEFDDYGKNNTHNQTGHGFVDWGNLTIRRSNTHGANAEYDAPNTWRTLSYDEWLCIIRNHEHLRKEYNDVYYFVLLPYGMTASQASSYSVEQLANVGAAFFPMCGNAQNDPNLDPTSWGYNSQICVWTSTVNTESTNWGQAGAVWFYWENGGYINAGGLSNSYYHRMQVRLAQDE